MDQPMTPHSQQELHDRLEAFEQAVETPFVPGEMEGWIQSVEDAWGDLQPALTNALDRVHPQMFESIRQDDLGLSARVDDMVETDVELRELNSQIKQLTDHLQEAIQNVEPDEGRVKLALDHFVDRAIDFIVKLRKQNRAIAVWSMESVNRDRGTVD